MGIAELPLDEMRLALAPALADAAAFDGWTRTAIVAAAGQMDVSPDVARLAFPGSNPTMAMIAAWIASVDADMAIALPAETLATLPIRQRIRRLVAFRLEAVGPVEEALRRAMAIMAMPQNAGAALKLGWHSADAMWRLAGDTATDLNYYSKRVILAGIYTATLLAFIDDRSEGKADTYAFLDRRIDGIMRFEKAKAGWRRANIDTVSPIRFLGRLRYPPR